MTTDIILALALGASIILNAMQASKAQEWRNSLREAAYKIEVLTRPIEDEEAVYLRDPQTPDPSMDDWLSTHKGVQPKPGFERKRR